MIGTGAAGIQYELLGGGPPGDLAQPPTVTVRFVQVIVF